VVPTWNYAVVHAHGPLRFIEDQAWLRSFVEALTNRHEAGRPDPWQVSDAPSDFIDKQLGAIVGIEIPVARLIGKWKVSQNRPAPDRDGVVEGLLRQGSEAAATMADAVRERSEARHDG
jgi:transcriptional regulator